MKQEHVLGFFIGLAAKDAVGPAVTALLNWIKKLLKKHEAEKVSVKTRIKVAAEQLQAAVEELES